MKVAVVFDPDPDLGPDPLDEAKVPRRLGEFWDSDKFDIVLLVREYGDQFEDGSRTHIFSSGIWENLDPDDVADAIAHISQLP